MIASQAGSLVDNAVFLAGLVLVGIGLIFLFSRTEYRVNLRGNREIHYDVYYHYWDSSYVGWL